MNIFVSVCRICCELGCVIGVSPTDLAEVYLRGWAQSTLAAYGSAYQDIMRYSNVLGKHWCCWGSGEVSAFFINGSNHLPNSIKKLSAVLSLIFGCCDKSSPAIGPLVTKVKVGVMKNVAIAKRSPRPLWTPENLLTFGDCPVKNLR